MLASIIVLQLITILIVIGNRKQGGVQGAKRPGAPGSESKGGLGDLRRGVNGNNRRPGSESKDRNGKPQQQQQGRPQGGQQGQQGQTASASIDPMEKSLRDINLRLKNAEREQENARKKFQESGSRDGSSRDGGRDGSRQQRGDRNDRGGRDGRRDFNRDRRPDRPKREFENPGAPAPESETASEAFHERPERHHSAPAAPDVAVNDFGVSEDQLQHGRKFTAKRRQLPEEAQGNAEAAGTVSENTAAPEQATESGEIQYGR